MGKLAQKKKIISEFYKFPVDDFRGSTDFNLYIIKDTNPIYDYRKTSKGYRKITGGYKIHATDNIQETKDNLKALNLYHQYYNEKKVGFIYFLNSIFLINHYSF